MDLQRISFKSVNKLNDECQKIMAMYFILVQILEVELRPETHWNSLQQIKPYVLILFCYLAHIGVFDADGFSSRRHSLSTRCLYGTS